MQFLRQMFNLSALLLDDALKPATPLTNGAINETLLQCPTQWRSPALAGWLSWIVDVDRPSADGHPKQRNRLDSSLGCLGPHVRLDERAVLTPQVRLCVPRSVWRCAVLLQGPGVSLAARWSGSRPSPRTLLTLIFAVNLCSRLDEDDASLPHSWHANWNHDFLTFRKVV